ncbi:TonB-dependent receptor plug domain-containing protein [Robiginitalea sp. SC105]|uniref:TonB-dependent receptor plug domain-containing protein n=1 Tax=Robiginitalea sp. SC105 TaxID=2762332 RepID=UPI0016395C5B|nr:TonB-dependent receptor plug domain-containing protein [Robiginitalea sp. SC105]MBC2840279.1 TonB-dependent receptor plug domain-containing protein [Robiginitalea sp. SC105]
MRTYAKTIFRWLPLFLCLLAALPMPGQVATGTKTIRLFWDASASMSDNEPVYAFRYLEPVFAACGDCRVELLTFHTDVQKSEHRVLGGDWSALKKALEEIAYDGAVSYNRMSTYLVKGETFIYTDGRQLHPEDRLLLQPGNTILSRATGDAQKFLERSALLYRGDYVQLKPMETRPSGPGTASQAQVTGTIYVDDLPAPGLEVRYAGSEKTARTDSEGRFVLDGVAGDSLVISGGGIKSRTFGARQASEMAFYLNSDVIALDEVQVSEAKAEAIEKTRTATGMRDSRRVGVAVQSIGDDEVSDVQTDLSQTLQGGRLTGVNLGQGQDATQFTTRTNMTMLGNNYGLIIIDGTPMAQSSSAGGPNSLQSASFIDPNNIADITVLKGLAATNKYGEAGRNGVLLITTKAAVYGTGESSAVSDAARVKNNIYDAGDASENSQSGVTRALSGIPVAPAYDRYLALQPIRTGQPRFFLEAYDAFRDREPELGARIISNLAESFPARTDALKASLYGLLETGEHQLALTLAEALNQPGTAPGLSLVTEALLRENRQEKAAVVRELIAAHRQVVGTGEAASEYRTYLQREIQNLFRANPGFSGMIPGAYDYDNCPSYKARLVFEWNLPGVEFAIQSVNPQKRFYNWEHTAAASPALLREERENGMTLKTFDLFGPDSVGEWLFNVELVSDLPGQERMPLVVGCRIYQNFGSPSETVTYRTVHLSRSGDKKQLISLQVR